MELKSHLAMKHPEATVHPRETSIEDTTHAESEKRIGEIEKMAF
jgi:hypothetical protein